MNIRKNTGIDWASFLLYLILISLGWISIYSSSYNPDSEALLSLKTIAGKQLFFMFFSVLIGLFILFIDIRVISKISYFIYFISIISLILVLFIGKEVGGAKAWFDFGIFGLQPAEFAKYGTILAIAKFIHEYSLELHKLKNLIKTSLFLGIPIILILQQPDAGSALIYTSLFLVFFREGIPIRYVVIVILTIFLTLFTIIFNMKTAIVILVFLTLILVYLLKKSRKTFIPALLFFIFFGVLTSVINYSYEYVLQPHQKERIDVIIGKEKDYLGSGYNLNQSLIAIGSGGLTGKGYLKGTQTKFNFVPEQNTDFIFCTIGEEFGFIGTFIIIVLFGILITRILTLSEKQSSRFSRIIGYSLGSIIFAHVLINTSMTLGLMPVIGIPLPFFSYGGSSLLTFSIIFFTFLKLNAHRTERF